MAGCSPHGPQQASTISSHQTCGGTWRDLLANEQPTPTEKAALEDKRNPEIGFYARKETVRQQILAESSSLVLTSVRVASGSPELSSMLATVVQTAPGQKLADAPIDSDLRRLWTSDVLDDIQVEIDGSAIAFVVTPHARVGRVVGAKGEALRRLALTAGAQFEPARISRMAEAARMVYVKDGHLDAAVDVYQHHASNGAVDLCVAATPGPRFTVGTTTITGATHVAERELRKALCEGNVKGDMLDQDILECDKLHLEAAYWELGYVDVQVGDALVTRRDGMLDIELPVTREGGQYHLGATRSPTALRARTGCTRGPSSLAARSPTRCPA